MTATWTTRRPTLISTASLRPAGRQHRPIRQRSGRHPGRTGHARVLYDPPYTFLFATASRLRFEMAFSNLFNLENLDIPSTLNVTSSAFGRINGTQTVDQAGPRTVQFSLRYSF